jgi:transposase-like protein
MMKKTSNRYSPEVRRRAVRMVLDHGGDHASQWAAIASIAPKIGYTTETLRGWIRPASTDARHSETVGRKMCADPCCTLIGELRWRVRARWADRRMPQPSQVGNRR